MGGHAKEMSDDEILTKAGETVDEVVETAKDAIDDLVEQAQETATGATEVPADIVETAAYASLDAINALTDRVAALEKGGATVATEATDTVADTVSEVAQPEAVPNVANVRRRPGWLDSIR
jgi:hypothetical protein